MTPNRAAQLGNDLCCLAASIAEIGEELKAGYDSDGQDHVGEFAQPGSTSEAASKPGTGGPAPEETSGPTLLDVRTVLAEKSMLGFQEAVRALIAKRGAGRLSDIAPSEYAALLKEAEALK
jgi:hypothetical protein